MVAEQEHELMAGPLGDDSFIRGIVAVKGQPPMLANAASKYFTTGLGAAQALAIASP